MPKSRFFNNKRGVSPLIATVLLISFAVALGSVVLNWGRNLEIAKPGDICAGVSIKIRSVNNAEVCYGGSDKNTYLQFVLDNDGSADIGGLGIWVTGDKGTKLLDFNELSIQKGELLDIKDTSIKYDAESYGNIQSIQFFPKMGDVGSVEICARSSIKVSNIQRCR